MIDPVQPVRRALVAQPTVATPAHLLQLAVEQGRDLAYVEKLMDLQARWEASQALKAYNEAFAAFKAEAVVVIKNREFGTGPLAGRKYAELASVVDGATPALSRHGLSISWKLTKDDKDWLEVTCTLKHAGCHFEVVSMGGAPDVGGAKSAIQARVSTKTQLERHTMMAICGLAAREEEPPPNSSKVTEADEAVLQVGRDEAMKGMVPLTAWWGTLNAKQRSAYSKDFAGMRKAAARADESGARG